jgi:fumarate reductase subunit D
MRALLLNLEPIIWLLFGQGILIGTMLLTGWILVVGLLVPMGIVDPSALSYTRAYRLATSWLLAALFRPTFFEVPRRARDRLRRSG